MLTGRHNLTLSGLISFGFSLFDSNFIALSFLASILSYFFMSGEQYECLYSCIILFKLT